MKKLLLSRWIGICSSLLLTLILTLFLFRESFSGLVLQGVDDNISMRMMMLRSLQSGQGYHFFPVYWLGYIFNVPNPDIYTTVLSLTNSVKVVGAYYVTLLLSGGLSYAFLRRLNIGKEASVFGALSYSFLPHVLSLVYSGHTPAISAIPMTPGFLLALTVVMQDKALLKKILGGLWAGIFWSQMVLGEPQRGVYGTVLGGAWVLYLMFQEGYALPHAPYIARDFWKKILPFLLLAPLIGLAVFYPTLSFWAGSEFAAQEGSWEFSTSWSFPPAELINSLATGYHGFATGDAEAPYWGDKPLSGNSDSLGFFLILFMLIGCALLWKNKGKRGHLYFFFFAGLMALLLSFGKYMPGTPFYWLWYQLPGMNKVRVPAKFLSITGLCWASVAAMGFQAWKDLAHNSDKTLEKTKSYLLYGLGGFLALSALWLALLFITEGGDRTAIVAVLGKSRGMVDAALSLRLNAVMGMAALAACLFVLVWGSLKGFIKPQYAGLAVIALTAFNLTQTNRFYIAKTYVNEKNFYPQNPLIKYLLETQNPQQRISGSLFVPNLQNNPEWPMGAVSENQLYTLNNYDLTYAFPYHDINAFGRIPISRLDEAYKTFFKAAADSVPQYAVNADLWEMNKRLWFMGNVSHILVDEQIRSQIFSAELARDAEYLTNLPHLQGDVFVYKLKLTFPRFALLNGVKKADKALPLEMMTANLQNLGLYQPIVEDSGILIQNPDTTVYAPSVERVGYNSYRIPLSGNPQPQMLVFGDLYDSGWKADIDGAPADITRANAVQQAFYVPANAKEITIRYDKPVRGLLLSRLLIILGILAALGAWVYSLLHPTAGGREESAASPPQKEALKKKESSQSLKKRK